MGPALHALATAVLSWPPLAPTGDSTSRHWASARSEPGALRSQGILGAVIFKNTEVLVIVLKRRFNMNHTGLKVLTSSLPSSTKQSQGGL